MAAFVTTINLPLMGILLSWFYFLTTFNTFMRLRILSHSFDIKLIIENLSRLLPKEIENWSNNENSHHKQ